MSYRHMVQRHEYIDYLGVPETDIELILNLNEVFNAIQARIGDVDFDVNAVNSDIPDPYDLGYPTIELLEVYYQDALVNTKILTESGDLDKVKASTKAGALIRKVEALLIKIRQDEEDKKDAVVEETVEKEDDLDPIQQKFDRLPIHGETLGFLVKLIGNGTDKGTLEIIEEIFRANKTVDSFDPRNYNGKFNLVDVLEQIIVGLNEIEASFPENDPSDIPDPVAYKRQVRLFSTELSQRAVDLLTKLEEIVQRLDLKQEVKVQRKEDRKRTTESLKVADLLTLSGETQLVDEKKKKKTDGLLDVDVDPKYKNEQQDKIREKLKRHYAGKDQAQILKNTITELEDGLNPQEIELQSLFKFFKNKIESRLRTKIDDTSVSQEMLFLLNDLFRGDKEVAEKVQRAKALLVIIRSKRILISNLNIILQEVQLTKAESKSEKTESDKNKEEIVRGIYDLLQRKSKPEHKDKYSLPEFDKFFEIPAAQAYDLLSTAIIVRIEQYYVDQLSSGSTAFAYHKGSIDIWGDDHMFSVPVHGAEDLGTFKYFIESFPWERFLPADKRTGPDAQKNITDFRQKMVDLWKYRILHIQNSSNAASGIENLWRGNEHGTYYKDVFNHIAGRGDGGGLQAWDMGPYYQYNHKGSENGDVLFREAFGSSLEENWLLPEYENYLLFRIQQKYDSMQLNDLDGKVAQLTADLKPGGAIFQDLYDLIKAKYGSERLKKDKEKIDLSIKKAIWNLTYNLKLHEFDKGGIHSKLGRLMNIKAYYGKVFGTGVSGVKWRGTIGVCVERALPPIESFQTLDLVLTDKETGQPIYDNLDVEAYYQGFLTEKALVKKEIEEIKRLESSGQPVSKDRKKQASNRDKAVDIKIKWFLKLKLEATDAIADIKSKDHVKKLSQNEKELRRETTIKSQAELASEKANAKIFQGLVNSEKWFEKDNTGVLTANGKAQKDAAISALNLLKDAKKVKVLREMIDKEEGFEKDSDDLLTPKGKEQLSVAIDALKLMYENIDKFEKAKYIAGLLKFLSDKGAMENPPTGQEAKSINRLAALYAIQQRYRVITIKPQYTGLNSVDALPIAVPRQRFDESGPEVIARTVQLQTVRDSLIAAQYVDLSALPSKPNTALNGHVGEAMKWIDFVDLTDHDAIFTPIHSKDPQDKLRAIETVFVEKTAVQNALLKLRISKDEFLSGSANAANTGKKLDEFLRNKIYVVDIPLHEIVSDSEKPGEKPPGLGFVKVIQYAGKYLFGKTPNRALFLEMFREYHKRLDDIVVEGRQKNAKIQKSWFLERTTTVVADFVRTAVDQQLDHEKAEGKGKLSGRAESEFIVGLFWVAVGAYLDQYSYDKEVGEKMAIPLTKDQRANEIETVETISGIKPMDFADRQLFMAYVERTLKFFSEYWVGSDAPRNIASVGNVEEMMEARGIIGSKQQIYVDLHAYESGRYASLVKKSSDKK